MAKWIEEFRRGWQGVSEPPAVLGFGLAVACLMLATAFRFGISLLQSQADVLLAWALTRRTGNLALSLAMVVLPWSRI